MQDYLAFRLDLEDAEVVSAYDELPLWSAMFGLLLLAHLPLRRHTTVLDVGHGTGFPAIELAERLGSTCRVHGIDRWGTALNRAKHKAQVRGVENVRFWQGDAAAMPFRDGEFDFVVSNLGVNNFSDPDAVLRECWRVSRPAAGLALTTNLQGHMQEFYEVFEATLRDLSLDDAIPALRRHTEHRATVEGLTTLFERTGFQLVKTERQTAAMRFADGSALLNHYFIKLGFLDGWKAVLGPADQARLFARLETNLNALARERGELRLTIPMAYVEAVRVERIED
jgi:arsenite methyltransferase